MTSLIQYDVAGDVNPLVPNVTYNILRDAQSTECQIIISALMQLPFQLLSGAKGLSAVTALKRTKGITTSIK